VTLKPITIGRSCSIEVNADASTGEIRVEVLDGDGKRVRGFSYDESIPIKGNSLKHAVQWKSGGLSGLPERSYLLRIHLKNATVYAITVREGQ
jgi:hypothetical protein